MTSVHNTLILPQQQQPIPRQKKNTHTDALTDNHLMKSIHKSLPIDLFFCSIQQHINNLSQNRVCALRRQHGVQYTDHSLTDCAFCVCVEKVCFGGIAEACTEYRWVYCSVCMYVCMLVCMYVYVYVWVDCSVCMYVY